MGTYLILCHSNSIFSTNKTKFTANIFTFEVTYYMGGKAHHVLGHSNHTVAIFTFQVVCDEKQYNVWGHISIFTFADRKIDKVNSK